MGFQYGFFHANKTRAAVAALLNDAPVVYGVCVIIGGIAGGVKRASNVQLFNACVVTVEFCVHKLPFTNHPVKVQP